MKLKTNQKGFSLVELMVVVAIIGILASVAIPSFNKFQRRARAAEGRSALGSLYNAQSSFAAEWEGYAASLAAIGFSYEGSSRSQVSSGSAVGAAGNTATRYQNEAAVAFAATSTGLANNHLLSGICGGIYAPKCQVNANGQSAVWGAVTTFEAALVAQAGAGVPGTYTGAASTNVGSGTDEVWTVNQNKAFAQAQDGINAN